MGSEPGRSGVVALVPTPPILVPELAGAAAGETADLRAAVCAAVGALPRRWLAVGVGPAPLTVGPAARGSFGGYGADLPVTLGPAAHGAVRDLPLCVLIAGWLRRTVDPAACVEVGVVPPDLPVAAAQARGAALRAAVAADPGAGVLVLADGLATLTEAAPGGFDPGASAVQRRLDDALAGGDVGPLAELPGGVLGRAAYQVLAGLAGADGPVGSRELYRGHPFGVGYFAGVWRI